LISVVSAAEAASRWQMFLEAFAVAEALKGEEVDN